MHAPHYASVKCDISLLCCSDTEETFVTHSVLLLRTWLRVLVQALPSLLAPVLVIPTCDVVPDGPRRLGCDPGVGPSTGPHRLCLNDLTARLYL